jgi:putative flavoprotein involved in K+ transport
VANVIWCTGYRPGFSWINLPIFADDLREPAHHRGIVASEQGLSVGLFFLCAMSSGFCAALRDAGTSSTPSRRGCTWHDRGGEVAR